MMAKQAVAESVDTRIEKQQVVGTHNAIWDGPGAGEKLAAARQVCSCG